MKMASGAVAAVRSVATIAAATASPGRPSPGSSTACTADRAVSAEPAPACRSVTPGDGLDRAGQLAGLGQQLEGNGQPPCRSERVRDDPDLNQVPLAPFSFLS